MGFREQERIYVKWKCESGLRVDLFNITMSFSLQVVTLQSFPIQPTVLGSSFPLGRIIVNDQNGKSLKPILLTWAFLRIRCLMDSIWNFEHKIEIDAEQMPNNGHQFLVSSVSKGHIVISKIHDWVNKQWGKVCDVKYCV